MIAIRNITRRFGKLTAVDRLNLELAAGEIFGLVGPDGAGKTTTLRMLCGLLDPDEGSISIAGLDVARQLDDVKDQTGYMAQRFGLYGDLTVDENLRFYGDLFGVDPGERDRMVTEFLRMTRMSDFRERPAAKLSGGMKQKLALICTLLHHPRVLLLDEPTNGVDPLSRRDFWEILYRLASDGMTILVTTSYLDEAERCNRVGLMHHGKLIECAPPAELKARLAPRSFRLRTGDLRAAREALQRAEGVVAAEPAGAALHVILERPELKGTIEKATGIALEPLQPVLEDVFIALIRERDRHAA